MGYTNGNGEVKMSAMQMTIFGIVFLIIAILAQEFLTKISEPILNWSDCSKENDMSIIVRGTTIPYLISIVFLLPDFYTRGADPCLLWPTPQSARTLSANAFYSIPKSSSTLVFCEREDTPCDGAGGDDL